MDWLKDSRLSANEKEEVLFRGLRVSVKVHSKVAQMVRAMVSMEKEP
jgi:beta-lactamase class D